MYSYNSIERFFDEDGHLPQLMNPYKLVFTKPEENAFDSPQVLDLQVCIICTNKI